VSIQYNNKLLRESQKSPLRQSTRRQKGPLSYIFRRMKTCLKSTMSLERLNGLAILNIESTIIKYKPEP